MTNGIITSSYFGVNFSKERRITEDIALEYASILNEIVIMLGVKVLSNTYSTK
jgi:hypothetical protein